LLVASELQPIFRRLHPALQPPAHIQVIDVHILHANGAAVSISQAL